jgi:hypothetical protein
MPIQSWRRCEPTSGAWSGSRRVTGAVELADILDVWWQCLATVEDVARRLGACGDDYQAREGGERAGGAAKRRRRYGDATRRGGEDDAA